MPSKIRQQWQVVNLADSIFRTDVPSCSFTDRSHFSWRSQSHMRLPGSGEIQYPSCQTAWDFPRWRHWWFSPLKHLVDVTAPARENEEKLKIGDRQGKKPRTSYWTRQEVSLGDFESDTEVGTNFNNTPRLLDGVLLLSWPKSSSRFFVTSCEKTQTFWPTLGWMASLTRWMWVSVNSGSWWWTGRPGVLRFMGLQRVGHDWATDLIWSDKQVLECSLQRRFSLGVFSSGSENLIKLWMEYMNSGKLYTFWKSVPRGQNFSGVFYLQVSHKKFGWYLK